MKTFTGKKVNRKFKGFTLIEVLVAMVIFAIVMGMASEAYRYFNRPQMTASNTVLDTQNLSQFKQVLNTLREVNAIYVRDDENQKQLYFYGSNNTLKYYTNSPILTDEPIAVSVLSISKELGGVEYCEFSFGQLNWRELNNIQNCDEENLFIKLGDNIEFKYFGWEDRDLFDKFLSGFFSMAVEPKPKWWNEYESTKTQTLPMFVSINFNDSTHKFLLSPVIIKLNIESPFSQRAQSDVVE